MNENEKNPLPMAEAIGNGFFDLEMSEDGLIIYRLSENAEQINPKFYAIVQRAMSERIMEFIKAGYVDYRFNDKLELEYRYTEAGRQYLEAHGFPEV